MILILPEIILAVTLGFVVIGEVTYYRERYRLLLPTALLGLGGAWIQTLLSYRYAPEKVFGGALVIDGFSLFFKLFFITLAVLTILASNHTREISDRRKAEFYTLILAAVLAMCLLSSATSTIFAFLAFQFMNVICSFLTGYGKNSALSIEAGIKYLVLSTTAMAFLLYGFALLLSWTQTITITEARHTLLNLAVTNESLVLILIFFLTALSFLWGSFPFFHWVPDVVEGTPTPIAGFLSMGVRAAGFAFAIRFLLSMFAQTNSAELAGYWQIVGNWDWTRPVAVISGLTMVIGALLAFRQTSAKRMVGCLAISESGFLLIGLLVLDQVGISAILYNLAVHLFSMTGIFYVLSHFYELRKTDRLNRLGGLLREMPLESTCLILFLISFIGLPPMPGFIGKFALIGTALRHQCVILAVLALFAMAIHTLAAMRLIYGLIGSSEDADSGEAHFQAASSVGWRRAFLAALLIPLIGISGFAEVVLDYTGKSLGFILW